MKLLIDTHVAIWFLKGDPTLGEPVRALLEDGANEIFISAASLWEAEIMKAGGKLDWPDDALGLLGSLGIGIVEMRTTDAIAAARLPPHHGDPFDRMMIAQTLHHGMIFVTRDRNALKYNVPIQVA